MKWLQAVGSLMRRRPVRALAVALPLALAACGGGDDDRPPPLTCSTSDQKIWLRDYMNDAYFWYRSAPDPDPEDHDGSLADYFEDRLFRGDSTFPADRWSYFEPTEEHDRFFGDGRTLGYGVAVTGVEVQGRPDLPLMVRYVAPGSPAEDAGVARGDQVLSLNGTPASQLIADDDFSLLTPQDSGDELTVVLRRGSADRSVTLVADIYDVVPVQNAQLLESPAGRRIGYVFVNDMLRQGLGGLDDAFDLFDDGIDDLVLDMRYNGGGLVSVAATLASYVAGRIADGEPFAKLLYSDRLSFNNQTFEFSDPDHALNLGRVYVLAGPRTCSASEQVVNGLRPFVDVVLIGDDTCGKPVGFLPQDDGDCGNTYSIVNFESVNADDEGRYFDGFVPTCYAADDTSVPIGDVRDNLLVTAASYADNGVCPATGAVRDQPKAVPGPKPKRAPEPGERRAMIPR